MRNIEILSVKPPTRWKFNSSPLKTDGWKTILSFWDGKQNHFSGAMSNSGGATERFHPGNIDPQRYQLKKYHEDRAFELPKTFPI